MNIYQEHVMDHYKHPRNRGSLEGPDYTLTDSNPQCGDEITVYFAVKDGKIEQAKNFTQGCAVSQAAASMLFEKLEGTKVDDLLQMDKQEILDEFGTELSVSRVKCALLALNASKKALLRKPEDLVMDTAGARNDEEKQLNKER